MKKTVALLICIILVLSASHAVFAGTVEIDNTIPMLDAGELPDEWKKDRLYVLADPAPWNLDELKSVVDLNDPGSVAAYFVWAVTRLTDDYDDGMAMMKYLFADIEPYGRGFTEGGISGKAGWDSYFDSRLKSKDYNWLPRTYFEGGTVENGFSPETPLTLELYYNGTNTETINAQSFEQLGRLNIVYWVKSHAGGNQVNITVSKFEDSDRWYVTGGASSAALFYDQRSAIPEDADWSIIHNAKNDTSTAQDHDKAYQKLPFTDIKGDEYYADGVAWAYRNGVTSGTSATTFGPLDTCTRGQVVTFLWRAAGKPDIAGETNNFTDVSENDYFYMPVLWARKMGITNGTSEDKFSPDEKCSSAHIITFLYRAMRVGNNGWYEEATKWAVENNLLDGIYFDINPETDCPRAAVVTFLERIYN